MPGHCDPPKEHRFKPGQSGNPVGRPKGSVSFVRLIREELERDGEDAARELIRTAIDKAKEGSWRHLKELIDRVDGPVAHRIEGLHETPFKAIDKAAADLV